MIYLILFIFFLYTSIIYDVLGCRRNRKLLFNISLAVLILISGLRYRLGADTIAYEYYFRQFPDLHRLTWRYLEDEPFEPFWVVLNSACKSVFGEFYTLQLCVSAFHISAWGYFVRKICPSWAFSMLFFFYLFEWTHMDMVLMREAVALGFFLLFIVALNEKNILNVILFLLCGYMFHKFSIFIFSVLLILYFLHKKAPKIAVIGTLAFVAFLFLNQNFLQELLANFVFSFDSVYNAKAIAYLKNEDRSVSSYNWKGLLTIYMSVVMYLGMLYKVRNNSQLVKLNSILYADLILVSVVILIMKSSFPIIYRFYDYFHTFTSLLAIHFIIICMNSIRRNKDKVLVYAIYISIPIYFSLNGYLKPWGGNPTPKALGYMEFYPYSSVLDPQKDYDREHYILNYAFN